MTGSCKSVPFNPTQPLVPQSQDEYGLIAVIPQWNDLGARILPRKRKNRDTPRGNTPNGSRTTLLAGAAALQRTVPEALPRVRTKGP